MNPTLAWLSGSSEWVSVHPRFSLSLIHLLFSVKQSLLTYGLTVAFPWWILVPNVLSPRKLPFEKVVVNALAHALFHVHLPFGFGDRLHPLLFVTRNRTCVGMSHAYIARPC